MGQLQRRAHDASVRYLLTELKVAFTLLALGNSACDQQSVRLVESARRTYVHVEELFAKLTIAEAQHKLILDKLARLGARLEELEDSSAPKTLAMRAASSSGRAAMPGRAPHVALTLRASLNR